MNRDNLIKQASSILQQLRENAGIDVELQKVLLLEARLIGMDLDDQKLMSEKNWERLVRVVLSQA